MDAFKKLKQTFPILLLFFFVGVIYIWLSGEQKVFFKNIREITMIGFQRFDICYINGQSITDNCMAISNKEQLNNIENIFINSESALLPGKDQIIYEALIKIHLKDNGVANTNTENCYRMVIYESNEENVFLSNIDSDPSCSKILKYKQGAIILKNAAPLFISN